MWRKRLRLVVALFVVIFAAIVAVSFRRGQAQKAAPPPRATDVAKDVQIQNTSGGIIDRSEGGKTTLQIKFGSQFSYADGRTRFTKGVTVRLPDKNGRTVTVDSQEAELVKPPNKDLGQAEFTGGVKLTTSDGLTVTTDRANYDDPSGMVRMPGPVTFTKGRLKGSGTGATYDQTHDVLVLLDQAAVDVAPDDKNAGAVHATAKTVEFARGQHQVHLNGSAHVEGEGRITDADAIAAFLTPDDDHVQRMELRGKSRITTKSGAAGSQAMSAQDIDLAYAADGRTLQTANLRENASVQLPGDGGAGGRRVTARTIDIGLGPDGTTVSNLSANERVQVDLPATADLPARRIRSITLVATGAGDQGLQAATFTGNVEFHESRAARKNVAAIERTARSQRLDVKTKPGFGDVEEATFHSNVHFMDGTETTADAPLAVYSIAGDSLTLSPPALGETGTGPQVTNSRIHVDAAHIQLTLSTESMKADTNVRSVVKAQQKKAESTVAAPAGRAGRAAAPQAAAQSAASQAGTKDGDVHMPAMLKQDQPVNVKSNRMDYDGSASIGTYSGNARLWQEETTVQADRIVVDDKNGNLHATTNVRTVMTLHSKDAKEPKGDAQERAEPTTTVAEDLLYEDAKRVATYNTKAHMSGPEGDVTADKIELYLGQDGGQLERAEAYGNVVSRRDTRRAFGSHLTYLPDKDLYTMVGAPVQVYDDTPPDCKVTRGSTLTFEGTSSTIRAVGNGVAPATSEKIACGAIRSASR